MKIQGMRFKNLGFENLECDHAIIIERTHLKTPRLAFSGKNVLSQTMENDLSIPGRFSVKRYFGARNTFMVNIFLVLEPQKSVFCACRLGYLENLTNRSNSQLRYGFSASKSFGYVRSGLCLWTFFKFCRPLLFLNISTK